MLWLTYQINLIGDDMNKKNLMIGLTLILISVIGIIVPTMISNQSGAQPSRSQDGEALLLSNQHIRSRRGYRFKHLYGFDLIMSEDEEDLDELEGEEEIAEESELDKDAEEQEELVDIVIGINPDSIPSSSIKSENESGIGQRFNNKEEEREKAKAAEEADKKAEEEARKKAEEEARKKAEEEARKKAEEEARKKAEEEEAREKAEEDARKEAEEETPDDGPTPDEGDD